MFLLKVASGNHLYLKNKTKQKHLSLLAYKERNDTGWFRKEKESRERLYPVSLL